MRARNEQDDNEGTNAGSRRRCQNQHNTYTTRARQERDDVNTYPETSRVEWKSGPQPSQTPANMKMVQEHTFAETRLEISTGGSAVGLASLGHPDHVLYMPIGDSEARRANVAQCVVYHQSEDISGLEMALFPQGGVEVRLRRAQDPRWDGTTH